MKKTFENIYLIGVFLFLFLPIAVLILFSFNTSRLNIVFEDDNIGDGRRFYTDGEKCVSDITIAFFCFEGMQIIATFA